MLPSTEVWKQDSESKINVICFILMQDASQYVISDKLKSTSFRKLSDSLSILPGGNHLVFSLVSKGTLLIIKA